MIGEVVGSYRVSAKLGESSTGVVYSAEHTLMGRRAAIKVFSLTPDGKSFFEVAQKAATIHHPGLVHIFDYGTYEGSAYLIMEYLEGETLADKVRRAGTIPVAEALDLAAQIATTLAVVHDAGVTHGYLTPDNVILVPDAVLTGGERAKLLDTGVAHPDGQIAADELLAPYMAPEQLEPGRRVDHRADFYALGCLLFEMLCGRPPFAGDGGHDIAMQHVHRAPPPPSQFAPSLPEQVDRLILDLLAKNPSDRPQSASEVETAIDESHDQLHGGRVDRAITQAGSQSAPVHLSFDRSPVALSPDDSGRILAIGLRTMILLVILVVLGIGAAIFVLAT